MGQVGTLFDGARLRRPPAPIEDRHRILPGTSSTARLIPGTANLISATAKKNSQSVMRNGSVAITSPPSRFAARTAAWLLPQCCMRFHPAQLGIALLDGVAILAVFRVGPRFLSLPGRNQLHPGELTFFLAAFLVFAIPEGLYGKGNHAPEAQCGHASKAVLWAILFSALGLKLSNTSGLLPLIILGASSVWVLIATRYILHLAFPRAAGDRRNLLLIGDPLLAQRAALALHRDVHSARSVEGFLPGSLFRGTHGPAKLRSMAREQCADEVIVATGDSQIAEAAIREARRNQLDVWVMANLNESESQKLDLETVAGIPLIKVHEQAVPKWALAAKRIADVVFSVVALSALSPLLLVIAAIIRLDSSGPVWYRAARVGRKKQSFTCYKFRTMIADADAAKEGLRSSNERDGAFFKISNDPRITSAGRFLRRYSLDELPQLWNVLRGDMSLVGPRPHPPDDVERYRVEDLQRLDCAPGITGLWQVTARRDKSFARSVALDVEYIQRWSLALDLKILLKTIPAVLQGSGA